MMEATSKLRISVVVGVVVGLVVGLAVSLAVGVVVVGDASRDLLSVPLLRSG